MSLRPAHSGVRGNVRPVRRGFTLVELLVAGVMTAMVLGAVSLSLSQLGRAKNTSKLRYDAFMRADAALTSVRHEIASIIRSDDLFYTRFQLRDDSVRVRDETFDRDEVLVFNTRLKPLRNIDFNGEGFEYESQFRIAEDDYGPVLWSRHDPMPDEYPLGGGIATPEVEGVISLTIEAYDGTAWYQEWDSDDEGLPLAVRVTVIASGHRTKDDVYDAPRAVLRTVISIDRVFVPKDVLKQQDADEYGEDAADGTTDGSGGADGSGTGAGDGYGNGAAGDGGGGTINTPGGPVTVPPGGDRPPGGPRQRPPRQRPGGGGTNGGGGHQQPGAIPPHTLSMRGMHGSGGGA